jgi:hypothetical protein
VNAFKWPVGMRNRDIFQMKAWLPDYPHLAQAPKSVKPTIVPGNHVSVRMRQGCRMWGFQTEAERDTFIVQFGGLPFP